jgi:cysteinyl-tRNA synthetase
MSKSTGNSILPEEMFSGENKIFKKSFSPMVVRFFMLQAHYRSILDISEKALEASEKGFNRLNDGIQKLEKLIPSSIESKFDTIGWKEKCYDALNDDFNSPLLIAYLFEAVKYINTTINNKEEINSHDLKELKKLIHVFFNDVLGLKSIETSKNNQLEGVLGLLSEIRDKARSSKDFETSDLIRDSLSKLNIQVNDANEGSTFKIR